jgi:thioredoxin 1
MSEIPSVTTDTFEADVLTAAETVLVEFWAEWCPPCRALTPVLEDIAREQNPALRIVKINSDEEPELALRYQIMSVPSMKIFRAGEVVGTMVGAKPAAAVRFELEKYLP